MTDSGHELRENNEKIVRLMAILKKQRDEINFLIEKQEMEKGRIQNDIEKLTFKLTLLTKSLNQRVQARNNYNKTIREIEENYTSLVVESGKLLFSINKEVQELEQIMDKRIGTPSTATDKPSARDSQPSPVSGQARRPSSQSERSASQRSQRDRPSSYAERERPSGQAGEKLSSPNERVSKQRNQEERPSGQGEKPGQVQAVEKPQPLPIIVSVEKPSILADKVQHDERPSIQTQRSERPSVQIQDKKDRPSILLTMSQKEMIYSMETTEDSEDEPPFKDLDEESKFSTSRSIDDDKSSVGSRRSANNDRNRSSNDDNKNKRPLIGDKKTARISDKEATIKRRTETFEAFPFGKDNKEELMNVPKTDGDKAATDGDKEPTEIDTTEELKGYDDAETESARSLRQDCGRRNCSTSRSLQNSTGTDCNKKQCCSKSVEKELGKKRCHKETIPEEHINQNSSHSKSEDLSPWRSISDSEQKEVIEEKEIIKETSLKKVESSSGAIDNEKTLLLDQNRPPSRNQTVRLSENTSKVADFDNIKRNNKYDDEVQSFREAYGRQHSQQAPSRTGSNRKNDIK